MRIARPGMLAALLASPLLAACAGHYMVTDPSTGAEYYTRDVDDAGKAGAVRFKDERTGKVVTLPTSEVKRISSDRYDDEVHGR